MFDARTLARLNDRLSRAAEHAVEVAGRKQAGLPVHRDVTDTAQEELRAAGWSGCDPAVAARCRAALRAWEVATLGRASL